MGFLANIRNAINKANQGYRPVYWAGKAVEAKKDGVPVKEKMAEQFRHNTEGKGK